MKWTRPGRDSGVGAYVRTLSLLSSDPCHVAFPRTLRASPAPGTDPAWSSLPSALPPPRLQRRLWAKELQSYHFPRLEVFGRSSLQAELQVGELEASVPRYSGCKKLEELLLPPADSGGCSGRSALPRRGQSGRRPLSPSAASPLHRLREPRASREPHHSAAPGAGPDGPARGAPESRGCQPGLEGSGRGGGRSLSFARQRSCRGLGHLGATSQTQVGSRSPSQGVSSGRGT
ncbi:uncharacterized protein LOC123618867 [Camelus bactrianus]|uniref:Uncharacterized protein LOC123618867 n=4 Tax=Camelus bactrianus TaxID=9837 RepID=A0AC58QGX8_CAMBA